VVTDVRFRKALMHALNRQEMVETFMAGLVPVAHTFINPSRPELKAIETNLVRYDYDPQRAMRMLEELGYSRGADGMLRDGSQQRLALEVRAPRNLDIQVKSLLSVVDFWQRVGIAAETLVTPTAQQMEREFRANYTAFEIVRQPNELNSSAVTRYHGSESPLPENNYVGTNRTRYRNAEWDGALDRWRSTIPSTERTEALGQIVRHMSDQLNIMGLFYDTEPTLIANRVKNVIPNAKELATTPAWNAHEWDVQ
jgi:peptide/nickel transport system substrate-binding protein